MSSSPTTTAWASSSASGANRWELEPIARQSEGNGVAERAIGTPKEQLLWVRHFATIEELRLALAEFAAFHNASGLRERHGVQNARSDPGCAEEA